VNGEQFHKAVKFEAALKEFLEALGEDPARNGLKMTPVRVRRMLEEVTAGYRTDPKEVLVTFNDPCDEMALVNGIGFSSTCEHHLMPFHGRVTVGYVPDGRIVGLSKVPRLVEVLSRRLQVQERLTREIAEELQTALTPKGVGVVITAAHTCMTCRGVRSSGEMITSHLTGVFRTDDKARAEFLSLARG
jgi:GTP cyclohydrolase I